MFQREAIYTVHENPDASDPSDRVVLVREGFSLGAFIFTVLWSLAHRLWLFSAVYAVLAVALYKLGGTVGLNETAQSIAQLGLQLWFGFSARDWQRHALTYRGYVETAVVLASSEPLAIQRFYDHQAV